MNTLHSVYNFFENIAAALGGQDNHAIIVAVYLLFAAGVIALRVLSHLHLSGVLISLRAVTKKEIASKTDAISVKNQTLKKAAAEYIRTAERSTSAVPSAQIAERAAGALSLFGWKYSGLLPFVETMEFGFLGAGLILAVIFPNEGAVYGLLAILIFVTCRVAAAFFNAREVRGQIADETVLFLEREIGRFFATDTSGAILRLKNDLADALAAQAAVFKETMEAIPHTMFGEGAERFSKAADRLQSASDLLASQLKGHSGAISEQLLTLISAITEMKTELQLLQATQTAIAKQFDFIETNQQSLEKSLLAYETSLQRLTQSVGDGLGAFINLHAQTSAQTINDAMRANIEKIMNLR